MSVDYYVCKCCEESVYSEYITHCSECGRSVGTECFVSKDKDSRFAWDYYVRWDGTDEHAEEFGIDPDDYKVGERIDDAGFDSKYCPFCSGNKVTESMLLDYALELLEINEGELTKKYLEK